MQPHNRKDRRKYLEPYKNAQLKAVNSVLKVSRLQASLLGILTCFGWANLPTDVFWATDVLWPSESVSFNSLFFILDLLSVHKNKVCSDALDVTYYLKQQKLFEHKGRFKGRADGSCASAFGKSGCK